MADAQYFKAANNNDLTTTLSWTGGVVPGSTDLGTWDISGATIYSPTGTATFTVGAISLTSTQTARVNILQPITLQGLAAAVGGVNAGVGVSKQVGSGNLFFERATTIGNTQRWELAGSTYVGAASASGLLTIAAGRRLTIAQGSLGLYRSNTGMASGSFLDFESGKLRLGSVSGSVPTPGSSTITFNSLGTAAVAACGIDNDANSNSITLTNPIIAKGGFSLGLSAFSGSVTLNGSLALTPADGVTPVEIRTDNTSAIGGAITGTTGFTKSGTATLTLSVANPNLSGDVFVTAGTLATVTSVNALQAATLNWTGTVGTFSPLTNSNIGAIKGSTSANTLALGASVINVGGINTSETFSGKFTGSGRITKNGTGTWTLDGDNSGHTGGFTVGTSGAGTLVAASATALGASSAGAIAVVAGSTLQVSAAISKASATLTLAGAGIDGNGALRSLSGTTSYTASGYTITSDVTIGVDAGTMTLGGAGAVMGTGGITKVGAGELVLQGESNTLDRQIVISAGTLTATKLAPAGTVSSLGRGNTTPAIALTGTLKFDGAGTDSTNRSITLTGAAPVLEATGSGSITYSAYTTSAMTAGGLITLTGTSASANALTNGLADGAGAVSLAKTGTGTWNLTGSMAHTGGTTLSDGKLGALASAVTYAATLNISGGELANGTYTAPVVMTGGTVTATLANTSTLTVPSGVATLQPDSNANTFTGNTTIDAGATLRLITAATNISTTGGKVLGDSNVNVSGSIRTSGDTVQKGQMRYGGNLTFQANAKLYVGSLA